MNTRGDTYVPGPIRNDPSVPPEVRNVWISDTLDPIVRPHYYDMADRGYNGAVTQLYQEWLISIGKTPAQLTSADAYDFLNLVKSSSRGPISEYLANIKGIMGNLFSFAPFLSIFDMWAQGQILDNEMRNHPEIPYFTSESGEVIFNPYISEM